jgi:hypothetical protein
MTNSILTWIIILIAGMGNTITTSNITLIAVMFFTLYFFLKRKEKFDKFFIYFTVAYFIIYAIHIIKFHYVDFREFREYIKVFYAYIFIKLVYKDFFRLYTNIIYKLALISLPLYFLQLYDYEMMKLFIGLIDRNIPFLDYREGWYENLFFFTLNDNGMYRNSGFAWEPKGFGTFLTLAFLFRLFLNKFKLIDKKNIVYLLAIITTLSTATYSIFLFAVLGFYLLNKKITFKLFSSLLVFPIVFLIFTQVDFMKEKIENEFKTSDKYVNYVNDTRDSRELGSTSRSLGRFGSMILDYRDFKKEPLVGYGLYSEKRTMYSIAGIKLIRVNGFSDFLAKFGLLGIIFLIYSFFKTFQKISKQFKFKGYYIIPLSILMTSFASAILLTPMYLSLLFYGYIKIKKLTIVKKVNI